MAAKGKSRNRSPDKARARILTVNPATRRIEAGIRDGGVVQVSVVDTGPMFRWPVEGELWNIAREQQAWRLVSLLEQGEQDLHIEDMEPGETKIYSTTIRTDSGGTLATLSDVAAATNTKYITSVHPGGTSFTIGHTVHGVASDRSIDVLVYELSTGKRIEPDIAVASNGDVTISFAVAVAPNSNRIVILG